MNTRLFITVSALLITHTACDADTPASPASDASVVDAADADISDADISDADVPETDASENGVSYATTEIDWPANVDCINEGTPETAKEIIIGRTRTVILAGGSNPISDAEWETYSPPVGNIKNSTRFLEFDNDCFWRSPSATRDCEGASCERIIELDGYTWIELSQIVSTDCVPAEAGCEPNSVSEGELSFIVTRKCHEIVFSGDIVELVGPNGQRAVMHATANGTPDLDVALPPEWSLERRTLTEDFVLHPFGEGDACFYNIIRDANTQSYHQYMYEGDRYP